MLTTDEDRAAADELVLDVLRVSGPFAATKEYRVLSSLGLRESADHVARLAHVHSIPLPDTFERR